MSEYDYSGLYNSPQNSGPAGSGQPAASDQPTRQEGGYPNVGSSGMNTANTARTDYSTASGSQPAGEAQQPLDALADDGRTQMAHVQGLCHVGAAVVDDDGFWIFCFFHRQVFVPGHLV